MAAHEHTHAAPSPRSTRGRRRAGQGVAAIAAAVVLLAGACGSRAEDGTSEADDPPVTNATTAADDDAMFGTIESPCGPGDASGATDIGVTDTEITVTSTSDSGGAVAGLNRGIDQSSAAFVQWCNDQGGINGRKIKLEFRHANVFDYAPVVASACTDSLALVGGLAVFDDLGVQQQVDCGLPNVPAAAVSAQQAGADLTWQPLPNPPNQLSLGMATYLKEKHPDTITAAGMISTDVATVDYIANRMQEGLGLIGFEFIYTAKANIIETNWPSFAIDMKQRGVRYFTPEGTWEELVNLQKALDTQDFDPEVTALETNFYQLQYPPAADGVAEGSYVQLTTWPFDETDNPAMATYLAALDKAEPGAQPEQLGVQSFSAWLLWATAVKSLGSDVTRIGLGEALSNVHSWYGGGLHGVSDPGANTPSPCFILMQVKGDGFERIFPTQDADATVYDAGNGFSCNDDYVVDLTTDWDEGVKASN